jgi:hypothetical protein
LYFAIKFIYLMYLALEIGSVCAICILVSVLRSTSMHTMVLEETDYWSYKLQISQGGSVSLRMLSTLDQNDCQ